MRTYEDARFTGYLDFVGGKFFSYIGQSTFTYRHFTFLPFVLFRRAVQFHILLYTSVKPFPAFRV